MKWQSEYLVGNTEIDEQHKCLFNITQKFSCAIANGDDANSVNKILDELSDCVLQHLQSEEKFLRIRQYPCCEEHFLEHNMMIRRFLDIRENFLNTEITASFELWDFLVECINKHFLRADLQYINFFNNKKSDNMGSGST